MGEQDKSPLFRSLRFAPFLWGLRWVDHITSWCQSVLSVHGRSRMFFVTPRRLNHSSLSEPIASLIQMPWHGSQLSRASLLSKSSGGVDKARRQETRMGKTRSFNEPCGGGNKNRSRRRLRLQGVGRGGVAMQGVEHREWTSSQLPHRGSGRYAEAA